MRWLPALEEEKVDAGEEPEQTILRVYMMVGGQHYFADVNVAGEVAYLKEA